MFSRIVSLSCESLLTAVSFFVSVSLLLEDGRADRKQLVDVKLFRGIEYGIGLGTSC
jgi:hypothetical protein